MRAAVIDLGSNSIRMDITDILNRKPILISSYRKYVRLSEGMGEENILIPKAIRRTLDVVSDFKKIIDDSNVDMIYAVATAALRTAVNKEDFLAQSNKIGIDFKIISGEAEAYYDYIAVKSSFDFKDYIIIDIGGASTELIYVKDGKNAEMTCIPYAAVNLTEKFFMNDTDKINALNKAKAFYKKLLDNVNWLKDVKNVYTIGLGGTIKALANFNCEKAFDIQGYEMDKRFVFKSAEEILNSSVKDRIEKFKIREDRADIISGGMIPLISVMDYVDSPKLISSTACLREGITYDIASK